MYNISLFTMFNGETNIVVVIIQLKSAWKLAQGVAKTL